MTWRRGEAGSTLIDRPKDAPVPDFTNGKERAIPLSSIYDQTQAFRLRRVFETIVTVDLPATSSHPGMPIGVYKSRVKS